MGDCRENEHLEQVGFTLINQSCLYGSVPRYASKPDAPFNGLAYSFSYRDNLSLSQDLHRHDIARLQVTQVLRNLRHRGAVGKNLNPADGENDVATDEYLLAGNRRFVSAADEPNRSCGRVVRNALDQHSRRLRNVEDAHPLAGQQ